MNPSVALHLSERVETMRLTLEPMGERHAEAFFPQLQEDALYEWIAMDKPESLEQLRARWHGIETRMAPDGQAAWPTWAVRRKVDNAYIGRLDAEINDTLEAINVGFYFFPQYWGKGYATEAITSATQHLLGHGVRRLVASVTSGNRASARVLEKAGYAFSRVLPGNDTIRGITVDDHEYVRVVA